jgi:hypothetical protein
MDTLLQKLQNASEKSERLCKYQEILNNFEKDTAEFIEERVKLDMRHPNRLSFSAISKVLRSENYSISATAIANHYSYMCSCTASKVAPNE